MILFWYVFRELVKYVIATLFLCVFLFLLFDFIHKTTRYIPRYNPTTELLVRSYIYQLPTLFLQAIPISSLLGSVICMVLLGRTNELTAMRAAGVGPFRLGLPVLVSGCFLSFLCILLGESVVPKTSRKLHFVQEVLIERSSDLETGEGFRWVKTASGFFSFKEYDPITSMLTEVRLIELGDGFRPKTNLDARLATFRPGFGDWLLEDIRVSYFWPKGLISFSEKKDLLPVKLPFDPAKLVKERRTSSELASSELIDNIRRGQNSGTDILGYRLELYNKIAFYFAPLIVCLISLKFGYKSERVMETAKSILIAVSIGMSYWFISSASRSLGARGILNPIVASWSANFIVLSVSVANILHQRRQ